MAKHSCPTCTCTIRTSTAAQTEPDLDKILGSILTTQEGNRLYTSAVFRAYADYCHGIYRRNPRLTQAHLTRHLRARGYQFHPGGSSNTSLLGYRLAS